MTKYREILHLASLGLSQQSIADSSGVSKKTVNHVLKRAKELNIFWPLEANETDAVLAEKLFPSTQKQESSTKRISFDVTVYGIALLSLEITSPTKTRYSKGEALDYTGFTATAVYGDGTTKDVTELVAFSTENGSIINEDTTITVSYTEGVDTVTNNFSAIVPVLQSLQVTPPTKTEYYEFGEILDYTGLKVIAKYKNIDSVDVTSAVIITPSDGSVITEDMIAENYYSIGNFRWYLIINISYTDSWGNKKSATMDLSVQRSHLILEYPTKMNYHVGDVLDYTGLKVEWQAKNGQKIDVTSSVDLSISEGTTIPSSWSESYYIQTYGYTPKTIYISYTNPSGDSEKRYFNIKVYP